MATKFTYKMRFGGKWDVESGTRPTQTNLFFKKQFLTANLLGSEARKLLILVLTKF
jgi:hypothetical protein